MKHIFIVNPAAGSGTAEKKLLPLIRSAVSRSGFEYEIHRTLNKQETCDYVRQKASEGSPVRFYACGGDGTLNDVLCGMIGCANAQLAVIPCGSGNDFAKNFSDRKALWDLDAQMQGTPQPCDVIRYEGGYSLNMLNIGVDCDVAYRQTQIKNSVLGGPLSYVAAAVQVLSKSNTYRMRYRADGIEKEEELMLCAIANGCFCGGGFKSAPKASVKDGMMDICIVRPVKGATLLKLLLKYHQGTHLQAKEAEGIVEYLQCRTFSLQPVSPVNVSVDGEVLAFSGSSFELLPGAVRIVVPKGAQLL
ncbi:MAG: diacylglycerol kinase family lipid kinase [Firmicutes bacterium]|nr:diacylglycerol kinase family lipid kinase [Bacillota bacterium]